MVVGGRLQADGLAKLGFGAAEVFPAEKCGTEIVVSKRRIRIQLDRRSQLTDSLRLAVDQKKGLSQVTVLVRTGRILQNSRLEFHDRGFVLMLRHQRAGQTAVAILPPGIHAKEFAELGDGRRIVAFVAIRVAEIVTNHGLFRRQALGLAVLRDGPIEAFQIVQQHAQVVVRLPETAGSTQSLCGTRLRRRQRRPCRAA